MSDITIYNYDFITPRLSEYKHVPLGQLYLISILGEHGYDAELKDFQFLHPLKWESIVSSFENSSDIIGVGCTTQTLASLILVLKEVKKKHPEKTVILGGPGPTDAAEEILKAFPHIDIVVRGEAEKTIVEVMKSFEKNKKLKNIRGISYREGNKIYVNPPRPRIENLDSIPFPAYEKIDVDKYSVIGVISTRGCPYRCGFCSRGLWRNKVTSRTVDNLIEEIKLINEKYRKARLGINDDTFPLSKKKVFNFCNKLKRERIDINWSCYGRINLMDEKIMKRMSESGCDNIFYGIESGSNKILAKINKGFGVKMAEDILKISRKYFHKITTSFIWGFPFETAEDFKKTIDVVKKIVFKWNIYSRLNILTPEKNTQIYAKYRDYVIPGFLNTPEIIFDSQYAPLKTLYTLHGQKNLSKFLREYPLTSLIYYRYKTPNFSEKMKILERFKKEYTLYREIKYSA